jgi:hypothetical protein
MRGIRILRASFFEEQSHSDRQILQWRLEVYCFHELILKTRMRGEFNILHALY